MTAIPKQALIVGASRGLGLGLVKEFLSRGWRVTATARHPGSATALNALHSSAPDRLMLETLDINDGEQVSSLSHRLGGSLFDLVLISAGVSGPQHQSIHQV